MWRSVMAAVEVTCVCECLARDQGSVNMAVEFCQTQPRSWEGKEKRKEKDREEEEEEEMKRRAGKKSPSFVLR
ncbi:hypothetical protein CesoFtcFv8_018827 [Champsocephalus esox]|uniref:Uncharacterized protein n=1 Tax=Champsocephalus esox TaxID=159716 RepID=A0AAN8GMN7_9TELE|nr:hypothetical protein CesoFtcFv8_018827 [Champsocephalus esox]